MRALSGCRELLAFLGVQDAELAELGHVDDEGMCRACATGFGSAAGRGPCILKFQAQLAFCYHVSKLMYLQIS